MSDAARTRDMVNDTRGVCDERQRDRRETKIGNTRITFYRKIAVTAACDWVPRSSD